MAVTAPSDSVPEGWIQFPDGTWGPPSPAPTGALAPSATGWSVTPGDTAPGTSLTTTPGTNLTTTPPVNRGAGGPGFGVGGGPHIDPTTGQPEMLTGPGSIVDRNTRGAFNPFGFVGRGNPYWRGAIATAGALQPTPAETGEFTPAEPNFVRPNAPATGGLPAAAVAPSIPIGGGPGNVLGAPTGTPAAAPVAKRRIDPASVNLGRGAVGVTAPASPFALIDRTNAPATATQPGRGYQTALDLSRLFGGRAPAAAPPGPLAAQPQRVPLSQTPTPPSRPLNQDVARARIKQPNYYT
jgi:hypothetical protein